ncbi:MAG: hypothetical protein NVSMB9_17570 [Isosphaeraceae bacterium]
MACCILPKASEDLEIRFWLPARFESGVDRFRGTGIIPSTRRDWNLSDNLELAGLRSLGEGRDRGVPEVRPRIVAGAPLMNKPKESNRGRPPCSITQIGLFLTLVLASVTTSAEAETIRSHHHVPPPPESPREARDDFRQIFRGDSDHWSRSFSPKLPAALSARNHHPGSLGASSPSSFWKRERESLREHLDPNDPKPGSVAVTTRVENHLQEKPLVASTISSEPRSAEFQILVPPSPKEISVPPTVVARPGDASRTPSAQELGGRPASPVPEPSSVASTLALFGLAAGWRGLRRRSSGSC